VCENLLDDIERLAEGQKTQNMNESKTTTHSDEEKWSHNIDVAWAESLIGLRMKVHDFWWSGYCGSLTTIRSGWIDKIDPSEKNNRNFMLMLDDPKWPGPFPMAYEDLLLFVDKDQEGYNEFYLPKNKLDGPSAKYLLD
jgi:hypothetical protein